MTAAPIRTYSKRNGGTIMIELHPLSAAEFPLVVDWVNAHDADFLVQWAGKTYRYPLTVAQMEQHYNKGINSLESGVFIYKIVETGQGEIIGTVQLGRIDMDAKEAAVGRFLIKSEQWRGRGIGTKALREIVRIGFEDLGLNRIRLNVFDFNRRAIRCYEKVGFTASRVNANAYRTVKGEIWNQVVMTIEKDQWLKSLNSEYRNINRLNWNDRTAIHAKSKFYDVDSFLSEGTPRFGLDQEELGDVAGCTMLHLQCHFGLDSLNWARLGALVTGVDFSEHAIALARKLNDQLGLNARFLCSDIYHAKEVLQGETFDIVYTSYGVLCWLPDLTEWAELIRSSLKPGGTFYMAEFHPVAYIYEAVDGHLKMCNPYFDHRARRYVSASTYTGDEEPLEHPVTYQWQHTLSEIVSSLAGAGLKLEFLHEFPFTMYNMFPGLMIQDEQGRWRMKENGHLPLLFSVKARKC